MGAVKSTHAEANFVTSLAWELGIWSTQVELDLVSSLAWELFVQPLLRYMLSPRWHSSGLVNSF